MSPTKLQIKRVREEELQRKSTEYFEKGKFTTTPKEVYTLPSSLPLSSVILFYFILFYFILFYFILFYFILFYFILFYFILFYFILFYFIYHCELLINHLLQVHTMPVQHKLHPPEEDMDEYSGFLSFSLSSYFLKSLLSYMLFCFAIIYLPPLFLTF